MSLFTKIRDFANAPLKSTVAADPLLHRLTTGHFKGGFTGFKERTAAGVHELYTQDRLAQRLGVREKDVTVVVMVVGAVIATYFTAGAASGAFAGAGAGAAGTTAAAGTATAGAGFTVSAGEAYTAAQALYALQQAQKAKAEQSKQTAQAEQEAVAAEQQAVAFQQAQATKPPLTPAAKGISLMTLAALAALLL